MKKLTKLFWKEFIRIFILIAIIIVFFGLVVDIFENLNDYTSQKNIYSTFALLAYRLPYIFSLTNNYILIISFVTAYKILLHFGELKSLLISGISYLRLFKITIIVMLPFAILAFINDNFISPKAAYYFDKNIAVNKDRFFDNTFSQLLIKSDNMFLFIENVLPEKSYLINTFLIKRNIQKGKIEDVKYYPILCNINGKWYANDVEVSFAVPDLKNIESINQMNLKKRWLNTKDIYNLVKKGKEFGIETGNLKSILIKRMFKPFALLLLYVLIFPLLFNFEKSKNTVEIFFITIFLLLIYDIVESMLFKTFIKTGYYLYIPPVILATVLITMGFISWKKITFKHRNVL